MKSFPGVSLLQSPLPVFGCSRHSSSVKQTYRHVMSALLRESILHSNQLFPRTQLPVDVGESRFEDITDWLPRAAVELNQSQVFDRPKIPRSGADFDPR